jgi:hypothetical protein
MEKNEAGNSFSGPESSGKGYVNPAGEKEKPAGFLWFICGF